MTFSDRTLTLLVLVALGLAVLGVGFGLVGGGRRQSEVSDPIRLDDTLRRILEGQAGQIQRLEKAVRTLHGTGKRQEAQEHFTTATTMYREMDMRFWLEKAEAEMGQLA